MARRTVAILVAVILALAAAGLVWWYASSVRNEVEKGEGTVAVLVAGQDIPARTTGEAVVEKSLAEITDVPERLVAPGALTSEAGLQGRVFTVPVSKGQQILTAQLGTPEAESLAFRIKKGMRAVSLPLDRLRGVGGVLTAGDRVDVIVTFDFDDLNQALVGLSRILSPEEAKALLDQGFNAEAGRSTITRTLLQQVEIMAIDNLGTAPTGPLGQAEGETTDAPAEPVVILMVSPADAERIVYAQEEGRVWLALVPSEDTVAVETPGRGIVNVYAR
ncbi:MAG: Flp pilus assembly protein CpaB [Thermoleophilia bacterium]